MLANNQIFNDIENANVLGNASNEELYGNYTSTNGHNLVYNIGAGILGGIATGNIIGQDPIIFPLADNGGLTHTIKIGVCPNSPALDAGMDAIAPVLDQRDFPRINVYGGLNFTDIGAFESADTLFYLAGTVVDVCQGANNGQATVSPLGGNTPFTFLWDVNAANQTTPTATGLIGGNYIVTVTDANGCTKDTTFTVVQQPAGLGIDTQVACVSYNWIDGNNYTTNNNTATHTIIGGAYSGCDSIVTLNLTISPSVSGTDIQSACNTYTWIDGNNYTASNNTATHAIIGGSINGCDSIVTLDLTINSSVNSIDVQTGCNSYTWIDGNNYTASNNNATHTIVGGAVDGCDSIITLNLTINNPVNSVDAQTACNTYTWIDGNNYTASNNAATYTIVGGASNNCDSIVTLNLTINSPVNSIDVQTACNTYTWIDGNNYTTSNNTATYTIVGGAANGCDSIITLNLTINNPVYGIDVQTACNSYVWIDGNNYTTSSSTAIHTIIGGSINGCDSIVTLNLTINNSVNGIDVQTACNSYTWIDGINYTTSNNTATHTIIGGAINGCDSIIALNLTIVNIINSIDTIVACDSLTWIDGNNYTTSNNAATHTIIGGAINGCDSLITLNLTINNTGSSTDTQVACDSYIWIDGNNYTASNNTATYTIAGGAANGCDSIITLNLTINITPVADSPNDQLACDSYALPALTVGNYFTAANGGGTALFAGDNITTALTNNLFVYAETGTIPNCYNENNFNISIINTPTLNLIDDTIICLDETLLLVPESNVNVSYLWQDNSTNSQFLVEEEGVYYVDAIIFPCPAIRDSVTISKKDCNCYFYLPNSFTPNDDAKNDVLKAEYTCDFKSFNFAIYNRWGEKLFETNNPSNGWNGYFKGELLPAGVYICKVNYEGADNISTEKVIGITLIK